EPRWVSQPPLISIVFPPSFQKLLIADPYTAPSHAIVAAIAGMIGRERRRFRHPPPGGFLLHHPLQPRIITEQGHPRHRPEVCVLPHKAGAVRLLPRQSVPAQVLPDLLPEWSVLPALQIQIHPNRQHRPIHVWVYKS